MLVYRHHRPLPDTSSDSVGAIIGGVIGGVTGLAAFLALVLAVAAFLLARRRALNQHKELKQPDYEQLVYGEATETPFTKKKAEVLATPELSEIPLCSCQSTLTAPGYLQSYRALEEVLLADEGRLGHAILACVRANQSEKVRPNEPR
jgi:hypothetical protein